jgi:hypothetical protein
MSEMFAADLCEDIANIKKPTLVLGTWIAYKQYTDRARTEANLHSMPSWRTCGSKSLIPPITSSCGMIRIGCLA